MTAWLNEYTLHLHSHRAVKDLCDGHVRGKADSRNGVCSALQKFFLPIDRSGSFTADAVEATRACMSAASDKRSDVSGRPLCALIISGLSYGRKLVTA